MTMVLSSQRGHSILPSWPSCTHKSPLLILTCPYPTSKLSSMEKVSLPLPVWNIKAHKSSLEHCTRDRKSQIYGQWRWPFSPPWQFPFLSSFFNLTLLTPFCHWTHANSPSRSPPIATNMLQTQKIPNQWLQHDLAMRSLQRCQNNFSGASNHAVLMRMGREEDWWKSIVLYSKCLIYYLRTNMALAQACQPVETGMVLLPCYKIWTIPIL